jgi:hypothetical protein
MYGEDPEWAFREIAGYGKPIWVTEFNNTSGSERQQAEGIKQAMTRLRELPAAASLIAAPGAIIARRWDWMAFMGELDGPRCLSAALPTSSVKLIYSRWRLGDPSAFTSVLCGVRWPR